MCGIHVSISPSKPADISPGLKRCLCSRGPDHTDTHETRLGGDDDDESDGDSASASASSATHLAFTSTVLALRGDHVARQPLVDPDSGSVLCWNGEAWKIRDVEVGGNDGEVVARLLREEPGAVGTPAGRQGCVLEVFRSIKGPFAFVYLDRPARKVYFGRDRLGRRSLLVRDDGLQLVLSSVADSTDPLWKEVEADGIYVLDLDGEEPLDKKSAGVAPAVTRLNWLEGEAAVDVVSSALAMGPHVLATLLLLLPPSNCYRNLPRLGFWYRQVQRHRAGRGRPPCFGLSTGGGPQAAVDRVAQAARLGCAHAAGG